MMSRRGLIAGTAGMAGSRLRAPANAPRGVQAPPGVQPGGGGIVQATRVIIYGSNGELLVYSGNPALGNLIAAITGQLHDPKGNDTFPGIGSYNPNGTALASDIALLSSGAVQLGGGFQFTALGGASPGGLNVTSAQGSGSQLELDSGEDSNTDTNYNLTLSSAHQAGTAAGAAMFGGPLLIAPGAAPPAGLGSAGLFIPATSTRLYGQTPSAGNQLPLSGCLCDSTGFTVTQTAMTQFSVTWTIPANDMQVGAAANRPGFRVTTGGQITQGATPQNVEIQLLVGGSTYGLFQIAAGAMPASSTFNWEAEWTHVMVSAGNAMSGWGRWIVAEAIGIVQADAIADAATSASIAFNPAVANTVQVQAKCNVAGPTMKSFGSTFERLGN